MQWVRNGSCLGYRGYDECIGYGMGHAWVTKDMMNAEGKEWVTPGLLRIWWMQWLRKGPSLGYRGYDKCSGYGMAAPGLPRIWWMQWVRNGPCLGYGGYDERSGYGMATPGLPRIWWMQWIQNGPRLGYGEYDKCSGYGMATPGLPRIWWMQWVRNGSRLGYWGDVRGEMYTLWYTFPFMFCTFHTVGHLWLSLSRYANNIHSVKSVAFRSRLCDINKPCT